MKNGFYLIILFHLLCLTSCNSDHDNSLTKSLPVEKDSIPKDQITKERIFSLTDRRLEDSSKYYFFVENEAGVVDYERYDFNTRNWQSISSLFQRPFIGGPLHSGRIIYQQVLWRDTARYLLLGKDIFQGMVLEVLPLAEIEINNNPSQSIYIMIPENGEYRMSECNNFDDWFTNCNHQRFFVQYWIEQQFAPRYIKRIQWKPFTIVND